MEPVIRKLIVEGFRSIRSEVVEFDNPTFLVGRNGSGKSNLVDALAFLGEAMTIPLSEVFSRRGGGRVVCYGAARLSRPGTYRTMGIGIVLGTIDDQLTTARYSLEIAAMRYDRSSYQVDREQCVIEGRDGRRDWFERIKGGPFRSSIGGLQPQLADEALALPLVGGDERFAPVFRVLEGMRTYSIDPGRLREWQVPDSGGALHGDGSNVATSCARSQPTTRMISAGSARSLAAIVPAIERVEVKEYGSKVGLEFTQRWDDGPTSLTLEASSMSDGTLRALGLLASIYQRTTPSLIAIEEPEATIHPGALGVILDVLHHASDRTQLVVTTHSPEVLDADWLEDRHIRIVTWREGATHVTPLDAGSCDALRQHLMTAGELLRSNALQGTPTAPALPLSRHSSRTLWHEHPAHRRRGR